MKRALQIGVVVIVALACAWGLRRAFTHHRGDIATAVAQSGDFYVTVNVRGSLTPRRSVEMDAPDITGLQITWLAPRGSMVKAGGVVARFDSSTARQDNDAKTAALRQAQATLDQAVATARIADQQDALDLATDQNGVASAQLDYSKAAILSPIDGDENKLALGMAQEKLKVEEATIASHKASNGAKIASATRLRDKAQADLDLVKRQLQEMEMSSPIAGVVNYLTNYSQGYLNAQAFKVGDSVWPNGTLAEIPDLSTLELLAKVSEVDRGKVALGEPVRIHLDSLPELQLSGTITAMSSLAEADFGSVWPPPQIFRLIATLDHLDPRLRPDMNASVDIITHKIPNAVSVPTAAIFTVRGKPVVYVQQGGHYTMQPVTVLARNPDQAAVGGVSAGARVALVDPAAPPSPGGTP